MGSVNPSPSISVVYIEFGTKYPFVTRSHQTVRPRGKDSRNLGEAVTRTSTSTINFNLNFFRPMSALVTYRNQTIIANVASA